MISFIKKKKKVILLNTAKIMKYVRIIISNVKSVILYTWYSIFSLIKI